MKKVKRKCSRCQKIFLANEKHWLDDKSISLALHCPKCRKKSNAVKGRS